MKAMILAAGRGERMRPLTDACPKPLLQVGPYSLIEWHVRRLVECGITEIVINHAWLGEQIVSALGDGAYLGADIRYSAEGPQGLETAGGIATALSLLGSAPFLVVNGDVFTDMDFSILKETAGKLDATDHLAHLVLVPNPEHHPKGDFGLLENGKVEPHPLQGRAMTFGGIGLYHPQLFADTPVNQYAKLPPILRDAMQRGWATAQEYQGFWMDIGTVERLETVRTLVSQKGWS